jgi:hypothetical protein
MTDLECLNEALEASGCTIHNSSSTSILVSAEGVSATIVRSNVNGNWSYRYEQHLEYQMRGFDSWFRELEGIYTGIVRDKEKRIEEEKQRQRRLEKEAEGLRQQAARSQTEFDSKLLDRLSELESTIARSKEAVDEAQRQLDSVEQSRMEYVTSTETELKERAQKGGWNLARNVSDPSRRVSMIRWTRKVSN